MTAEQLKQMGKEIRELAECVRLHMLDTDTMPDFFAQLREKGVEAPASVLKMVAMFRAWRDDNPGQTMHTRELWASITTTADLCDQEAAKLESEEVQK